jgi:hypothetical protein
VTITGERDDGEALSADYQSGITTIVWTATDSQDRTATCTQTITVHTNDTTAPTVTAPDDLSLTTGTDAGSCGLIVGETELDKATASDNCGRVNIQRTGVPAGNFFPIGTTTITYTAKDGAGNTAIDTQTVTITDNSAPTITATAPNPGPPPFIEDVPIQDVTVHTGPNSTSCDAVVSDADLGNVQARDNCAGVILARIPAANTFPVGTTTIVWTATDASNNTGTAIQHVTVIDDTPPTITAPVDVTAGTGAGRTTCDADVALGTAITHDNCAVTVTHSPQAPYPVGTTIVTWTVTDASGNTATATQDVTVTDTTAPTFTTTANDSSASADASCHASVPNYAGSSTASDNCAGNVTITQSPAAGTLVGLGPHTVTVTATDAAGNPSSHDVVFTVNDTTAPIVQAPADSSASADASCRAAVPNYVAASTASDNCVGALTLTQSPAAGTLVGLGTYTVTVTATDNAGNHGSDDVVFTVNDTTAPTITLNGANPQIVECHTSYNELGATANDNCSGSVAVTSTNNVNVNAPGSYIVTYSATDGAGNTNTATRTVNVIDTIAPTTQLTNLTIFLNNLTIVFNTNSVTFNGTTYPFNGTSCTHEGYTISFNGSTLTITYKGHSTSYTFSGRTLVLWTPTHQYQTVKVIDLIASASDGCDSGVNLNDVRITQVTSDEPDDVPGGGDGNTTQDMVIASDCKSVQLRAERDGNGNGRVYTITSKVRDASNNTTTVTSKLKIFATSLNVVEDVPQNTVNGTCALP